MIGAVNVVSILCVVVAAADMVRSPCSLVMINDQRRETGKGAPAPDDVQISDWH